MIDCKKCPIKDHCQIQNDFYGMNQYKELKEKCCPLMLLHDSKYHEIIEIASKIIPKKAEVK